MAQGKALLSGCGELLKQKGMTDVQLLQKHGTLNEILSELSEIRLLVLGRRGTQNPIGSQLESVIRLQKKPILVVPESFRPPKTVMFAFDGSNESLKNLTRLTLTPLLQGGKCHIVMVNGDKKALWDALDVLENAGLRAEAHYLTDDSVTDGLCRHAENNAIDLIIMGAYGHSRLRRFIIGSHTTDMLSRTGLALLMLR